MKTFRSIAAAFFCTAIFAVSAFAQTAPTGKIGIINTGAFDAKEGITKYVKAMNDLEVVMKPEMTTLQTMSNRIQTLKTELEKLQEQLSDPSKLPPTIDKNKLQADAQKKYEEYQKIGLEFEYKQKDYKASLERNEAKFMSPVRQDIGIALQDFGKKNGYMMILDASKLDGAGLLLQFDDKFDVTKEFITFYNTRPATTAAVK